MAELSQRMTAAEYLRLHAPARASPTARAPGRQRAVTPARPTRHQWQACPGGWRCQDCPMFLATSLAWLLPADILPALEGG